MTGVRLIATDLDGTLLGPDGRVADSDAEAILAAHARGVQIVVATGRPARWLGCLEPIRDADPHVIVSNGAAVVDLASGAMERIRPIPTADLHAVEATLRAAIPGVLFAIEHGHLFGCEVDWPVRESDPAGAMIDESLDTVHAAWPELTARDLPVVKMLAMAEGWQIDALLARAADLVGDTVKVTHSTPPGHTGLLEMSAPGVTKASTLAAFCAELGIAAEEVAAFGDMPNDVEMLTFAGHGYAMGNAHASLRGRFPMAPTNVEGGVGVTVRRLLG